MRLVRHISLILSSKPGFVAKTELTALLRAATGRAELLPYESHYTMCFENFKGIFWRNSIFSSNCWTLIIKSCMISKV